MSAKLQKFMRWSGLAAIILVTGSAASAAGDPFAAKVLTSDVDLFYQVYDAAGGRPTADQLQDGYLDVGSDAVRDFVPNRIVSAKALERQIGEQPELYEQARVCRAALPGVERRMRSAYLAFQAILPEANLPDTTILIGRGNSGGTTSSKGVLIGLEVVCDPTLSTQSLNTRLFHLVAHELGHTQQTEFDGDSLLALSLNEGVAEFVGELISGAPSYEEMFREAEARAPEIEQAFAAEMFRTTTRRWLYNGHGTAEWPGDLGYWTGYRIARSYYDRAADKRAAVRSMLNGGNAKAFLEASGWSPARLCGVKTVFLRNRRGV